MRGILVALAAAGLALPALAQETPTEEVVTCEQFAAMNPDDQMTALSEVAEDEHAVTEETVQTVSAACAERPEVSLADTLEGLEQE